MNHTIDELPASIRRVNELRAAAGRAGSTSVTVSGGVANVDDLVRFRDVGVDRVIVMPFTSSREAMDGIRRFGDDVIARFAASS
jgi:hypothetical protein